MLRRYGRIFSSLCAAALLALSCGGKGATRSLPGKGAQGSTKGEKRPALEARYPLLRWVPESADALLVMPDPMALDELLPQMPVAIQQLLPASMSMSELGLAPSREVVLMGRGPTGTVVAEIEDAARFDELRARLLEGRSVENVAGKGGEASYWAEGPMRLYLWRYESWLFLHSEPAAMEVSDLWIDELVQAYEGRGLSASDAAERALAAMPAGNQARAAGMVSREWILDRARESVDESWSLCVQGLLPEAHWWMGSAEADQGELSATLVAETALVLEDVLGPPASTPMSAMRERVGAHLSSSFDLGTVMPRLKERSCWPLYDLIDSTLQGAGFSPPPRNLHLLASHINAGAMTGQLAVEMATHGKRSLSRILDQLPGRSFFESGQRIEGERFTKLSFPSVLPLYYQNQEQRVLLGTSHSLLASLLTSAPTSPDPAVRELVALGLRPALMPQLRGLFGFFMPRAQASEIAAQLEAWESIDVRVLGSADGLRITLRARPSNR